MTGSILIVDDEPVQRRLMQAAVTKFGYEALLAEGGQAALDALESASGGAICAVVLDLGLPDIDGIGVLRAMRDRAIAVPVIVLTSQGGLDTVVAAMRNGAFDFVVKPASPERLRTAIANALKVEAMEASTRRETRRGGVVTFRDIVTESPAMARVIRLAQKAAASSIPILIEGESGVGKELVARAIQGSGDRRKNPFVTVNCGAIPGNLVESILFGHEKGSFTGATEKHTGKFVEAHGGTLFLDEVGDLPLDLQVKLLRAVQEGEIDPVGGKSPVKVDIRLISATHRNLLQQVKDGAFREDLFYRLNVYPIVVPPLRERREDIPQLVRHFMAEAAKAAMPRVSAVSDAAMSMLQAYDWPGNIRQLENAVFRAAVLCEGDVLTQEEFPQVRLELEGTIDLDRRTPNPPASINHSSAATAASATPAQEKPASPAPPTFGIVRALDERGNVRPLADVELDMIRLAIDHYNGQMSEVARRLGIGRSTLYRKLKEYGIDPEEGRLDRPAT